LVGSLSGCNPVKTDIGPVFGDFNNDGQTDQVFIKSQFGGFPKARNSNYSYKAYISLGVHNGGFLPEREIFNFDLKPLTLSTVNLNKDGNLDLTFLAYDTGGVPRTKGLRGSYDMWAKMGTGTGRFGFTQRIIHYEDKPLF